MSDLRKSCFVTADSVPLVPSVTEVAGPTEVTLAPTRKELKEQLRKDSNKKYVEILRGVCDLHRQKCPHFAASEPAVDVDALLDDLAEKFKQQCYEDLSPRIVEDCRATLKEELLMQMYVEINDLKSQIAALSTKKTTFAFDHPTR